MSDLFPEDFTTLKEARAWLWARIDEGAECPCCDQFAKAYRRKLNSSMARVLIGLVRAFEADGQWHHVTGSWLSKNEHGDMGKLAMWGFVEQRPKDEEGGGRTSGWWRPTEAGVEYAHGRRSASTHARIYDAKCLGMSEGIGDVRDALGEHFDYRELMELGR